MPSAGERARFASLRDDLDERLKANGSSEERRRIHDRLHGFLMGFSQLRALDGGNAALMVAGFVEAVDGVPVEAVHRACRAWNQRKFSWPNYAFPPTPPDLCRAAREIVTEMKVERHDLHVLLIAKPPEPPVRLSDEERRRVIEEAAARPQSLLKAIEEPDTPRPSLVEIHSAREAHLRDVGASAARAMDAGTASRLFARLDAKRPAQQGEKAQP